MLCSTTCCSDLASAFWRSLAASAGRAWHFKSFGCARILFASKAVHVMSMQAMAAEPLVTSWLIASSQAIVTRLHATGMTFPRWWIIRKFGPADDAWFDSWGTLVRDIVLCSNLACTAVLCSALEMPLWNVRRALTGLKIISRKPALAPISEETEGPMLTVLVMGMEAKKITSAKGQVGTRWVVRLVDGAVEVGASHPNAVTLSGRRAQAELPSYAHPCAANEYRTECIQVRRFGAGIDSCHGVVAHRTNKPLAVAVLAELEPRHAVAVPAGSHDLLDALTAGSVEAP